MYVTFLKEGIDILCQLLRFGERRGLNLRIYFLALAGVHNVDHLQRTSRSHRTRHTIVMRGETIRAISCVVGEFGEGCRIVIKHLQARLYSLYSF